MEEDAYSMSVVFETRGHKTVVPLGALDLSSASTVQYSVNVCSSSVKTVLSIQYEQYLLRMLKVTRGISYCWIF